MTTISAEEVHHLPTMRLGAALLVTTLATLLVESHLLESNQEAKWADSFLKGTKIESTLHIVELLKYIALNYLTDCSPMILFDSSEKNDDLFIEKLLTQFPIPYFHGRISDSYEMMMGSDSAPTTCVSYILFLTDVMRCRNIIGDISHQRVVVIVRSSQWRVLDFLMHEDSRVFMNILVIVKSERIVSPQKPIFQEAPYILYTHELYADALGSSRPIVLTSYQHGRFTRLVNLFPKKMSTGFSGHRFVVAVAHQPPFVSREKFSDGDKKFVGIEVGLVEMLSRIYNFTTDYREATDDIVLGSSEAVTRRVEKREANLGIGGIYLTLDKLNRVDLSRWHSEDCAAFASLSSTALPRYRAIMGPFHWTVWMSLVIIYLFGIIPLSFFEKHSLKQLINNPEEIENMFWYVFGTFTNCFTFIGKGSWSRADKMASRLLIVFYWLFTIIVTACYTGSIIAFVTLPVYPDVVDTVSQLKSEHFQIGILDKGEWPEFVNYAAPSEEKLLNDLDLVPNIQLGLKNVTTTFFWNYAFMGSKAELEFVVKKNMTLKNKRSILHVSKQCFIHFGVSIIFPKHSIYRETFNRGIERIIQSGLINKIKLDVEWEVMRSSTGKLLAANSRPSTTTLSYEDRALTLDDTQGMFLLLSAGYLIGAAVVTSEFFGGCFKFFARRR